MSWQNMGEGLVSSMAGTLILNFLFQNINKKSNEKIKFSFPKDPLLITLSITIFFGILSLFGFYYEWVKFSYLVVIAFVFGFLTFLIYEKQCPKCKKIFSNNRMHTEVLHKEKRPYKYRDLTIYYYSDGTEKNRKHHGKEKTRIETIETRQGFYECSCGHKWKKSPYKINLDLESRPKPDKVRTTIRNPEGFFE